MCSKKIDKNVSYLVNISKKGDMNTTHGALLTSGGKIISTGYNHLKGCINNKILLSCHAEMHAMINYFTISKEYNLINYINDSSKNIHIRSNKQNLEHLKNKLKSNSKCLNKKIDLYVIRTRKDDSFADSKPCSTCAYYLKLFGFRNCYYSNDDGMIIKKKINDLDFNFTSDAHESYSEFIKGNTNTIFKKRIKKKI